MHSLKQAVFLQEQELIHGEPQENVPCVQSEVVPEEVIQKVPQVEAEGTFSSLNPFP